MISCELDFKYLPASHANITETSPQMRSVGACGKLQASGEAGTDDLGVRESSLAERTLGAFLLGTSYSLPGQTFIPILC